MQAAGYLHNHTDKQKKNKKPFITPSRPSLGQTCNLRRRSPSSLHHTPLENLLDLRPHPIFH